MYCPKCNKEFDGKFCPECGTQLIEKSTDSFNINLGDANAISGGINLHDSHAVHNEDKSVHNTSNVTNVSNTSTIYEAQRTQQEILQDNENEFIKAVRLRVADGLTRQKEAELDQIARDWKINPMRAKQLIEAERKSAEALYGGQDDGYYVGKVLQNIFDAVNANQLDIVNRLFKSVEEIAKTKDDANIQYYYYMLLSSLNPAGCTVSFVNHHTDNYWQLFWTCVAYVKLGQTQNATALVPRLAGFGGPHGDMDLLTAIENLVDCKRTKNNFYKQQLQHNIQSAVNEGMSEQLSPLWYAVQELTKEKQEPEEWFAFYVKTTLMELGPEPEKQMQKGMPQMPTPPQMPKFDPQAVQLKQSLGWNPLQAAQQMGIGQMPGMGTPPPFPNDNNN